MGCATDRLPTTSSDTSSSSPSSGSYNTLGCTTTAATLTPSPSSRLSSPPHVGIDMSKLQPFPSRGEETHQQHQQQQLEERQEHQQQGVTPQTTDTLASNSSASSLSLDDDDDHHPTDDDNIDLLDRSSRRAGDDTYAPRSPILPVRIDLANLGYKPPHARRKQPRILQGVNACFEPGQLVAVMGPSGSGKSTLLRLIQGDHRYLRGLKGEALANGTSIKAIHGAWRHLCSLVPQEDVLLGSFTVRETMRFSTQLRLPQERPVAEKEAVVTEVLEDLGILDCQDVLVKDVSGGQRRRVSVGLELLVNPR